MRSVRKADNLTTIMCRLSWNLGASTSWNTQDLKWIVLTFYILSIIKQIKRIHRGWDAQVLYSNEYRYIYPAGAKRIGRAINRLQNPNINWHGGFALNLILLTWRIWWDPNNARNWQMGINSVFKGLISGMLPSIRPHFTLSCHYSLSNYYTLYSSRY